MSAILFSVPILGVFFCIIICSIGLFFFRSLLSKWINLVTVVGLVFVFISTSLSGYFVFSQLQNTKLTIAKSSPRTISFGVFNPNMIHAFNSSSNDEIANVSEQIRLLSSTQAISSLKTDSDLNSFFGHYLEADGYRFIFSLLILFSALVVTVVMGYLSELNQQKKDVTFLHFFILLTTLSALLIVFCVHLMLLYFLIELIALQSMALIVNKQNRSGNIAIIIKYWVTSVVSSGLFLLGIAFCYSVTKELSFSGLSFYFSNELSFSNSAQLGLCLIIIGFLTKLGFVPFHFCRTYLSISQSSILTLFTLGVTQVALYCSLSQLFLISPIVNNEKIKFLMISIAVITILYGNVMAFYQKNIKEILAYSSLSLFGYLLVPLIAIQYKTYALETILLVITSYVLSFVCVYSGISLQINEKNKKKYSLDDFKGLFGDNKLRGIALSVGLLSLASFPLTLGFMGRFYLIMDAVTSDMWFFLLAILLSTVIGVYFYLRLVILLFIPEKTEQQEKRTIKRKVAFYQSNILAKYKILDVILILSSAMLLIFGLMPDLLIKMLYVINVNNFIG